MHSVRYAVTPLLGITALHVETRIGINIML